MIKTEIRMDLSQDKIESITSERLRKLDFVCGSYCEENFYDKKFLEVLTENDEIRGMESGFMEGYIGV